MINCTAEFYKGTKGRLFRLTRTPENINAHLIYIAPLFEQANQTRHMSTRSAINVYSQGVQSVIFDHFGTGDSEGELIDASLVLWQEDIMMQINAIKISSSKPVFLSVLLSAALLLNDEVLALIDGLFLSQPNFNGKSFTRQFKRLAVAGNLSKAPVNNKNALESTTENIVDIAGYQFTPQLFDSLASQSINNLSKINLPCSWFEWLSVGSELTPSRKKLQQAFQVNCQPTEFVAVDDIKFWQTTELQLAKKFLQQEQQVMLQQLAQYKTLGRG
jgi:exosortase A-associated hydrolase 2